MRVVAVVYASEELKMKLRIGYVNVKVEYEGINEVKV